MKKIIFGLVISLAAVSQADSYLYWMLGDTGSYSTKYNGVQVVAVNQNDWSRNVLTIADENFSTIGSSVSKTDAEEAYECGMGYYANLSDYANSSYLYYIELLNDTTVLAHTTGGTTWSSVADYISKGSMSPATTPVVGASFVAGMAIPEPTSGMLMVFGAALLALRRRRKV